MLDDRLVKIGIPEDADIQGFFQDRMLVSLRTPWTTGGRTFAAGSLLAIGLDDFLRGSREFDTLFEPGPRVAFSGVDSTASRLFLTTLDNVHTRIQVLSLGKEGWTRA